MSSNFTSKLNSCWNRIRETDALTFSFAIKIIPLTFLNLMIVVGNGLVIMAILRYKRLRNVAGLMIASLAIADLMVGILVMPFSAINELLGFWVFDSVWCQIWLAIDVWMCTSSIYNLLVIALDRFIAVTRPLNYRSLITHRRAFLVLLAAWLLSFLISLPPMIVMWPEAFQRELDNCTCTPMANTPGYIAYSSTGSFFLPFIVLFYLYFRIYITVREATTSASRGFVALRSHDSSNANSKSASPMVLHGKCSNGAHNAQSKNGAAGTVPSPPVDLERVVLRIHRGKYSSSSPSFDGNASSKKYLHKMDSAVSFDEPDDRTLTTMNNKRNSSSNSRLLRRKKARLGRFSSFLLRKADENGMATTTVSTTGSTLKMKMREQFIKKYHRKLQAEIKAVKTVSVVTFCFVGCWLGFSIIYTLQAFAFCQTNPNCIPSYVFGIFFWLGYANSAVNPLIYAACNRQYRNAFKEILVCKYLGNKTMSSQSTYLGDNSQSQMQGDEYTSF